MMAKYRKKPVVVEAFQTDKEVMIHTLEGNMKASVGEITFNGAKNEMYFDAYKKWENKCIKMEDAK